MTEFLDFNEISQRIPFANVLDYLNIPYTTKGKELRGEGFIVDTGKDLQGVEEFTFRVMIIGSITKDWGEGFEFRSEL